MPPDADRDLIHGSSDERMLALGRVLFSGLVLATVVTGVDAGTGLATFTAIYAAGAVALAIAPTAMLTSRTARWIAILLDVAALVAIIAFADDTAGLFFATMTFALLAAAARWSWRGVSGVAAIVVALLVFNVTGAGYLQQALMNVTASPTDIVVPDLPVAPGAPMTTASLSDPTDSAMMIDSESILRIGAVVIASLMLGYLAVARERMHAAARRLKVELRQTAARMAVAEQRAERDRSRLARDVHDGILQDLAAANLLLRSAVSKMPEAARSQIAEATTLLSGQQLRLRALVETVNAKPRSILVVEEMESLAATLAGSWHRNVVADVARDVRIPSPLWPEIAFFFSEATANAVRHGQAANIRLVLKPSAEGLVLECIDDGASNEGDGRPAGFVPFSLNERVADLGGRLTATRTPKGARVHAELPLR